MKLFKSVNPAIAALVALALVAALVLFLMPHHGKKYLVADFPRTVSLYNGSDVRILGVPVGTVDSVTPMGTMVRVKLSYDDKYKLPADAKAVVISPSIVGDRYVQLTPVYRGGAVLADNAELGTNRTAVPLELDQIFGSLNDLDKALGPDGANAPGTDGTGALTRLLDSTARNFGGQGVKFNQTLHDLGKLTKTLADNKDELFGTATEVEKFVHTLAKNDDTVRQFTQSLADGSNMLAMDRKDLGAALDNLSVALVQVRSFVHDNKAKLTSNIAGITRLSNTLVKRRSQLDEVLHVAPLALNNLALAYNSTTGTLDVRDNVGELGTKLSSNPGQVLCALINEATTTLPNCPLAGLGRSAPFKAIKKAQAANRQHIDLTLGGLVAVKR